MGKMHCKKPRGVGVRRIKTLSITFSLVMLEFFVRMIYNNCYSVCACSSVDRAPASGAGCVGSIPVRRTKSTSLHCREVLFSCSNLIFPCSSVFPCSKAPARRSSSVLKSIFRCSTKKSTRAQTAQALYTIYYLMSVPILRAFSRDGCPATSPGSFTPPAKTVPARWARSKHSIQPSRP